MDFISIGFNLLFRAVYAKKDLALKVAYDFSFPGLVAYKPVAYIYKNVLSNFRDSCKYPGRRNFETI